MSEILGAMEKRVHQEGYGMLVPHSLHIDENPMKQLAITRSFETFTLKDVTGQGTGLEVRGTGHREAKLIPPLLQYSLNCTVETPQLVEFPLSPDHCLITLVQYNVVRAYIHNMSLLSLLHHLPPGCSSSFGVSKTSVAPVKHIPLTLQSTPLQSSKSPPFWISPIPFPRLRDNLILMVGQYDSRELLLDLGLRVYEGFDDVERCGFLVWGDPWLAAAWEVSEGFVRRWGFLLQGCSEVIEAANHWRMLRGDERLVVDI
jgi:hypothetical protein